MPEPNDQLHRDRQDLVKRLFAVAISVGFAARVIKLDSGSWPTCAEWEQITRLLTAMVVVIYCWDWYHRDIERKKYKYIGRFILDVASTFTYMVFLYSVDSGAIWSFSLFLIFLLFVIWDFLAVWERPESFGLALGADQRLCTKISTVYRQGRTDPTAENRGPYVNFWWTLYFLGLWALGAHPMSVSAPPAAGQAAVTCSFSGLRSLTMLQVAFSCLFVLAGIFILRCDGNARQENYRTWNYVRPAIIIALLVLLYSLVPRVINWIV